MAHATLYSERPQFYENALKGTVGPDASLHVTRTGGKVAALRAGRN